LAQGLLTNRYLGGIPADSRAGKPHGFLKSSQITPEVLARIRSLNEMAEGRGQSLARMAIAWLLKDARVTSVLIGASSVAQLEDNLMALKNTGFSQAELEKIEIIIKS
jgi:L-glyceraldehyde 3-phosphate reductase